MTNDQSSSTSHTAPSPFRASRITRYSLLLILCIAFAVRVSSITFQSLWRDEVDAICFAQQPLFQSLPQSGLVYTPSCPPSIPPALEGFASKGFNGPLYFLLLRGWMGLVGSSAFAIRFMSLAFGVISVALIFVLGQRLFNRSIGLIAASLLTFSAYQVWYSQEAKMYTLITMLALASLYFLRRGIEDGHKKFWLGVIVCTSLAVYAHILAALLIPVEAILFLIWWRHSRAHLRAGLITLALLTLPYLPLALWEIPLIFTPGETGFAHYSFVDMLNTLGQAYTIGVLPFLTSPAFELAVGLSAALAIWGLLETKYSPTNRAATFAWLAMPFIAIFVVSINRPLFTDRYLIWIEGAYILLIAIGLHSLWRVWKPIGLAALGGLIVLGSLGIYTQSTTPFKPDFRDAAQTIGAAIKPDDAIVFQIPYVRYNFDYYFRRSYPAFDGPYTNFPGNADGYRDSPDVVFKNLDAEFKNVRSVWLVLSEEDMWDRRHLLRQYLDAHGTASDHVAFANVEIAHYELK